MSGRRHIGLATLALAAIVASFAAAPASAQTLRFDTSVGSFDMELNPTNDSNLQPLVDNIVAYVGLGRYHYTAINRAAKLAGVAPGNQSARPGRDRCQR
jgi:hypothetical protein